jgi:phosphoadenosine phosphosulfate reductase
VKVLQFSGGADSLATLYVKRPEWNDITVLWCNTGAAYPSTVTMMEKVRTIVPHFREVRSDKPAWEKLNGLAVDVVPERLTMIGAALQEVPPKQLFTSFIRCCAANIWAPLDIASRELGATVIIRGQRASDKLKAPIKSGHVDPSGIRYEFPIEDWSRDDVFKYCLGVCPELFPSYYLNNEDSSHDCWDCIAYLGENVNRIKNLTTPERIFVFNRLSMYQTALRAETAPLKELL